MSHLENPESGAKPPTDGSLLTGKKVVSWKEIASHLGREIRTVQRWEKTEGLPIRRHEHQKKSTVYAYTAELDEWFKRRQPGDDPEADAAFVPEPDAASITEPDVDALSEKANGGAVPPVVVIVPDAEREG